MTNSPRLSLPFLAAGQAQKEFFHNEALLALDALVGAAVDGMQVNAPPASPASGTCFVVGSAPTGDFAGKANQLAAFSAAGWRFHPPAEGLTVVLKTDGRTATFRSGSWTIGVIRADSLVIGGDEVVSTRSAAIASPGGGTTIDSQGRAAIDAILTALRHHGLIA